MKTIKQLSIFLENKAGRLVEILDALKAENIEIQAAAVADTNDFGILRLITSNQAKAQELLAAKGILVSMNEIMAISVESDTASFTAAVDKLTKGGVNVSYLYTFQKDGKLVLIIRTDNLEQAEKVCEQSGLELIQGWE